MKIFTITLLVGLMALASCKNESKVAENTSEEMVAEKITYDTNVPMSMLHAVAAACGGMDNLKKLKDVAYDYHYLKPDGKKDISQEKYIFDNEISWAKYSVHEENVSPNLEGDIVQYYDGKSAVAYNNGVALNDPEILGTSQFLRQANYMWFTMMYKLSDPGTITSYEGQEDVEGKLYDVLKVSYDPAITGKEENDTYILYIDPTSHMVESFKFSLPAFGVPDPVLLAKLTYKEMDGVKIASRRQMFAPNPEGGYLPIVDQQLRNIKFNNGFTAEGLSKEM